ncbi:MAG: Trm112 family protein [Glaciecola sp.]|jgi:uncharacterized protein YbaR (Trm112 family)
MAFDSLLLSVLACPICKGSLVWHTHPDTNALELVCKFDRLAFPVLDDAPILIEQKARSLLLAEYEQVK